MEFTRFSYKNGVHDFEKMLHKDAPNYQYESIKLKKKQAETMKKFAKLGGADGGKDETAEGKLNRSVEELSDCSDSDDVDPKGKIN